MGVPNVEMGGNESEVDDSSGDSVVGDRDAEDAAGDVASPDLGSSSCSCPECFSTNLLVAV